MAHAIVEAVIHWEDAGRLAKISEGLGEAMPGLEIGDGLVKMQERGL